MKHKIKTAYWLFRYDIPSFFRNLWSFKKAMWNYREWDASHSLTFLRIALEKTRACLINGNESESSRDKKVAKMTQAILLLKNFETDNFIDQVEKEMGGYIDDGWLERIFDSLPAHTAKKLTEKEIAHNISVTERIIELEKDQWNELWDIIKGQEVIESKIDTTGMTNDEIYEFHQAQFDGSGLLSWWE